MLKTKYGNRAPSTQEVKQTENGTMLVSYNTNIAKIEGGDVTLDERYWDYSRTTGFYRNQYLGEGIAETHKKIEAGVYTLANLNK